MTAQNGRKIKVVAVDDDAEIIRLMRVWLPAAQYDLVHFSSAVGVREQLAAMRPDVAVLDIYMPQKDGFELCKEIRSDPGLRDLPVIFLSSSQEDVDFLKTLALGGDSYLTKPVDPNLLRKRIKEVTA